jgi:hypothetical protein
MKRFFGALRRPGGGLGEYNANPDYYNSGSTGHVQPPPSQQDSIQDFLDRLVDALRYMFDNTLLHVKPYPFQQQTTRNFALAAGVDVWLDQYNKLQGRRAFAIFNSHAANVVWESHTNIVAAGMGTAGQIDPKGTISFPCSESVDVHVFSAAAGTNVTFYQFA